MVQTGNAVPAFCPILRGFPLVYNYFGSNALAKYQNWCILSHMKLVIRAYIFLLSESILVFNRDVLLLYVLWGGNFVHPFNVMSAEK